jgi:magnesium-transporting ATPase (P-type)
MNRAEFDELKHANDEFETESSRVCLETDLTFAATFFLADPLRAGVHDATIALHDSGTKTRILSGDHEQTTFHVAEMISIIQEGQTTGGMSGKEFAEAVTPLTREIFVDGVKTYEFVSEDAKKEFR